MLDWKRMDSIHFEGHELGEWAGLSLIYRTPEIRLLIAQCEVVMDGPGAGGVRIGVEAVADIKSHRWMIIEMSRNRTTVNSKTIVRQVVTDAPGKVLADWSGNTGKVLKKVPSSLQCAFRQSLSSGSVVIWVARGYSDGAAFHKSKPGLASYESSSPRGLFTWVPYFWCPTLEV